jgi:hypothetical protein
LANAFKSGSNLQSSYFKLSSELELNIVIRLPANMNRKQQLKVNQRAVSQILKAFAWIPSYENAVYELNTKGINTSRGNPWTKRSLYRMLQRQGYRGLHGLFCCRKRVLLWG